MLFTFKANLFESFSHIRAIVRGNCNNFCLVNVESLKYSIGNRDDLFCSVRGLDVFQTQEQRKLFHLVLAEKSSYEAINTEPIY